MRRPDQGCQGDVRVGEEELEDDKEANIFQHFGQAVEKAAGD